MITINGRELHIPECERLIGIRDDTGAEIRAFVIPRYHCGVDLADKTCILWYAADGTVSTGVIDVEAEPDRIIITWHIDAAATAHGGPVLVHLQFMGDNYNMQTEEGEFRVGIVHTADQRSVAITIPAGRMKGDINGDGAITQDDLTLLNAAIGATVILDETQTWCADVNSDNTINAKDVTGLSKYLAGTSGVLDSNMADFNNAWTYVSTGDAVGYWYTDISVVGVTVANTVSVDAVGYTASVLANNMVRITAQNVIPITNVITRLQIS